MPSPADDTTLDAILQSVVVGVTGMPGTMVRPRWQNPPPTQPDPSTDWCAIGVTEEIPDDSPYIVHDPTLNAGDGADVLTDHEEIGVLASFYGPNAGANAKRLRNGLQVPQNTEVLGANQIRWVSCGVVRTAPDLVNAQWVMRRDITMRLRRKTTRIYSVESLLVAEIHLFDDTGTVDDTIVVPPGATVLP